MTETSWEKLSPADTDAIWSFVYDSLRFTPSVDSANFPGFKEPAPSVTFSFRDIWGARFDALEADLQKSACAMFEDATPAGASIYALDWQHDCYRFQPATPGSGRWMLPALPNGDYHLFLSEAKDFGWLGHPWEQTICIFGTPLLNALKKHRPKVFRQPIRKRG